MNINKYRIFGLRLFDLILSLVAMIVVFLLAWRYHFRRLDWWKFVIAAVLLTLPLGIIVHTIVGVNTQLSYDLGLSYKPKGNPN
jgi:NADH:ubiquinone oxidoreductase subunit 3 (subunit A)